MDVLLVICNWDSRYEDHNGDVFIELWADDESSLPGIAQRILESDSELCDAFSDAGIEDVERDRIILDWLTETLAGGQYGPVWNRETDWAECLHWWSVERIGVHGVKDCGAALDYAHAQYQADKAASDE
jgi:hypothetical protein